MSSRNRRLPTEARRASVALFQSLQEGRRLIECGHRRKNEILRRMRQVIRQAPGVRIDYIAVVDPETLEPLSVVKTKALLLLAVRLGKTRLIDCCEVK